MAKSIGALTVSMVNDDMRYIKGCMPELKKAIREGNTTTAKDIANELSGIAGNWASYVEDYLETEGK